MACCWTRLAALLLIHSTTTFKLVCHFANWSQYRTGKGRFIVEDINPFLCTHVVYDFVIISHDNKLTENEWGQKDSYRALNQLKNRNSELKTLLSVRESSNNEQKFAQLASSAADRQTFIHSSIFFLRANGFDGLELDWDPSAEDKHKFTQLCKELRLAFDEESVGDTRLLLSASLTPLPDVFTLQQYDIVQLTKLLDFISVKTFDLIPGKVAAHHSPLYSSNNNASIDYIIKYWISQKAPTKNLLLGFPVHARSYTLSTDASSVGDPVSGPASPGPHTQQMGFWSYYETCVFLQWATSNWIESQYVPYAVKGNQWVGFDNNSSYGAKVKYLKSRHLGGVAVWSIDLDDFSGNFCYQGNYPLISHLKKEMSGELNNTTPIEPENPQTTERPHIANSPATDMVSGRVDPSCFNNITVQHPDSRLCKGRADGRYQTSQEPHLIYTCALGKAYVIECPTVHSRGVTASRDGLSLSLLLTSTLQLCYVYR